MGTPNRFNIYHWNEWNWFQLGFLMFTGVYASGA